MFYIEHQSLFYSKLFQKSQVVLLDIVQIYQLLTPIELFPLNSQQKWTKAHNCVHNFRILL